MAPDDPTVPNLSPDVSDLPARAGKYRIVGRIGHGGMGFVYRAEDDDLERTVALKFLPPDLGHDSNEAHRFLREARAASLLDHVNIGTIFGVEQTEDHRRFIVMAYYEGQTLSERMKDESNPICPGEAVSIAIQVARGLAEAHACGVIHRDIKPSNILLTAKGVVKIIDFGLASVSGSGHLTMTGERMGTPAYMSPERASGKSADHRSDIWALGVVLLEMLVRQPVFSAPTTPGVLYRIVHDEVPLLDRVQQPFRSILTRALQKEPAKRYQSLNDFLAALEAVESVTVAVRPVAAATLSTRIAASFRAGMRRWRLGLAPALLLAAISTGALYFSRDPKQVKVRPAIAGAPASPTVFDKYLEGVELMKRWDKKGNLEKAVALLTEATKSDPSFALGFARLAEAERLGYMQSRDKSLIDAAGRAVDEAMRLDPRLATVQVASGRVQAAQGHSDLAMASFESALKIDPNDADAHLAIARQYEKGGRLRDAEAEFQKAGSLDPDSLAVHDQYANFLYRQYRHNDAIREWQTVVQMAPDDHAAYVNLCASLNDMGRFDEAIKTCERAIQLKRTVLGYSNLATAYSRTGSYKVAIDGYSKALELAQDDSLVWGNLAFVYAETNGLNDQAKQTFKRAIDLAERSRKDDPRDPVIHSSLATYYAKTGNAPLARLRIDTALTLSPRNPEIQADAAEVYELLGQRRKALEFAKRSLELGYARLRLLHNPELAKLTPNLK